MAIVGLAARPGRGVPAVHDTRGDAADRRIRERAGPEPPSRGCSPYRPRNRRCGSTYAVSSGVSFQCRQGVSFECRLTQDRHPPSDLDRNACAPAAGRVTRIGTAAWAGSGAGGSSVAAEARGCGGQGHRAGRRRAHPWPGCRTRRALPRRVVGWLPCAARGGLQGCPGLVKSLEGFPTARPAGRAAISVTDGVDHDRPAPRSAAARPSSARPIRLVFQVPAPDQAGVSGHVLDTGSHVSAPGSSARGGR